MNHKNSGLTLVEVLIVLTILSILVLSLYTVFKTGFDAWSRSEARLDVFQNARVILDQISRELPGAFVGGGATFEGNYGGDDETADDIAFATDFAGSIYQINYWLDTVGDPSVLKREYEENPVFGGGYTPTYTTVEFTAGKIFISNIKFLYWGPATTDWSVDALTTWSSGTTLPEAVRIAITLMGEGTHTYSFENIIYLPNSE